jgi:hypothetical protein
MRHNSLGALIQMLRREMGIAESPALGRNTREAHAQALRSAQQRLYTAWDWPFKKIYRDKAMVAGERYYQAPTDLDLENIREVQVLVASLWQPCIRGISSCDYNTINSDAGARQDPVWRWDLYNDPDDNGDMIEVWPIPATTNYSRLRFFGVKKLAPLVADTDKADLDDLALVLTAAADLTTIKERTNAQAKADRYVFMLARNLNNDRTFISGGGSDPSLESYRPTPIVIAQ